MATYVFNKPTEEEETEGTCVWTDAMSPSQFVRELSDAIVSAGEIVWSEEILAGWLSHGFEVMAKLKGYKSEKVNERRNLWCGDIPPSDGSQLGHGGSR